MSEILTLAAKFKTQSQQQAKTIEQEVQNATTQLNSFMTAKLQESETIIKQGMESLDTSSEDLKTLLSTQKAAIDTALKAYLQQLQAPLTQDLNDLVEKTQTLIESYSTHIENLIQQREDRLAKIIKSEMKTWAIVSGLIAFTILLLGIVIGALLIKKFSKPTYIIQQPQTQQPINFVQS